MSKADEILQIQEKIKNKIKLVDATLNNLFSALESGEKALNLIKEKINEFKEYKAKLDEQMELFNNTLKYEGDI